MKISPLSCYISFFLIMSISGIEIPSFPGYYTWPYGDGGNLFCPDTCTTSRIPDECCMCEAKPCWELKRDICPVGTLHLEYLDIFGKSSIVGTNNESVVELINTKGSMTVVPENICTWQSQLVALDLRYNRLRSISRVKCLTNLDTLRLDFNRITYIENTTFTDMKNLRVLTVSNNLISQLDPNVIKIKSGNIAQIDFSNNHYMDEIDITNVFRPGPFCTLNFTNSSVEYITNEIGFIMEEVIHGPGDIHLENSHLGSFINFTSVGIEDMKDFGKYIDGQTFLDESSVACDCTLYPLLNSLGSDVGKYWPNLDGNNFECHRPEHMKGKNLVDIINAKDLKYLECDISEKPDCPHYLCHCIDSPSQQKVLVNCTGVGFTSMPNIMPVGAWNNYKIDLILADNYITVLFERNYFTRLVNLDLRNNGIKTVTKSAASSLSSTINIENQVLENLPPVIQQKDPKLFTFGDNPIVCDCSNTWIGEWIRLKNGHGRLNCLVDGVVIPAERVTESSLQCKKYTALPLGIIITSAVGTIAIFLLLIVLSFVFRYEILIYKRSIFKKTYSPDVGTIDIFLSFNVNNDDVFRMVNYYIKPALVEAGYTVFIPWCDILYGDNLDAALATGIDNAVNYVVILCDNYATDHQSFTEFETLWKSFVSDQSKQIILINFDNKDAGSIKDNRIKALRRTACLDFRYRDNRLITRLKHRLGKPVTLKKNKENYDPKGNDTRSGEINPDNDASTKNSIEHVGSSEKISVFEKLAAPKSSECNSKFRKCYLHGDSVVQRHNNKISPLLNIP